MSDGLRAERIFVRHPEADRDSLRDLTIEVQRGEVLAILGPNGSGKSTLLRALGRELPTRAGRIVFEGEPLAKPSPRALARRMGRLPQDPIAPEGLTVQQLVELGRHPHLGFMAAPGPEDLAVVSDALAAVGLSDLAPRAVETLSGGERRRAWIAMALAQEPEWLLLDEPTSALDLRHQLEVLELLRRLNAERGTTIVLSIHDLEQAARVADRVALLCRGRLYDVGPPADVLTEETLLDVYRVHARVLSTPESTPDSTPESTPESTPDSPPEGLSIRILGPGDPVRSF